MFYITDSFKSGSDGKHEAKRLPTALQSKVRSKKRKTLRGEGNKRPKKASVGAVYTTRSSSHGRSWQALLLMCRSRRSGSCTLAISGERSSNDMVGNITPI